MISQLGVKVLNDLLENNSKYRLKYWVEYLNHQAAEKQKSGEICHESLNVISPCQVCLDFHLDMHLFMLLMERYSKS